MEWKQIFERAKKTGAFTDADLETAKSWPHCAVGDNLRSRGYDKSHASDDLGNIIVNLDFNLKFMGRAFTTAVSDSNCMSRCKQDYNSDEYYRKQCISYINEAQRIYDMIQKTKPSQALIDHLGLKATPAAA